MTLKKEDYTVRVPRSQRGGEIVEPLLREQWFVRMQPLAEPALQVGFTCIAERLRADGPDNDNDLHILHFCDSEAAVMCKPVCTRQRCSCKNQVQQAIASTTCCKAYQYAAVFCPEDHNVQVSSSHNAVGRSIVEACAYTSAVLAAYCTCNNVLVAEVAWHHVRA